MFNRNKSFFAIVVNATRDQDPTRTITLRSKFIADLTRRFKKLSKVIYRSVAVNDCFALGARNVLSLQGEEESFPPLFPLAPRAFQFRRDAEKVREFEIWLQDMIDREILEVSYMTSPGRTGLWADVYLFSAYQRGLMQARQDLKAMGAAVSSYTKQELAASLAQPFNADRVALIFTRVFTDLEGVTDVMSDQISRVLAQGIAEGINPYQMARRMTDRVEKIGITRARLIARTETIRTFNEAALMEYEAVERVINEPVLVKWWTALDERVRTVSPPDPFGRIGHRARHGQVYTRQQALGIIGEPNCRCSVMPYIKDIEEVRSRANT